MYIFSYNNQIGLTGLHVAASNGDSTAAQYFIDKSCEVNFKDSVRDQNLNAIRTAAQHFISLLLEVQAQTFFNY